MTFSLNVQSIQKLSKPIYFSEISLEFTICIWLTAYIFPVAHFEVLWLYCWIKLHINVIELWKYKWSKWIVHEDHYNHWSTYKITEKTPLNVNLVWITQDGQIDISPFIIISIKFYNLLYNKRLLWKHFYTSVNLQMKLILWSTSTLIAHSRLTSKVFGWLVD